MHDMRNSYFLVPVFALAMACGSDGKDIDEKYGYELALAPMREAAGLSQQTFAVDNRRDTVLFGKQGTIVSVPANCFTNANGPVELDLIEALDMSDLLLLNAPTISDGRLLVTDGVVYVNAFANGKALVVKEGMALEVEVPSNQLDEAMESFVGEYDGTGRLTWQLGNEMRTSITDEIIEQLTYEFLTIPMELFPNRAQYIRMDSIARTYPWVNGELSVPDEDLLIGKKRAAFYADAVRFLNDPASVETPMATREFAQRLTSLEEYFYFWYWPQPDGSSRLAYDVFGPFQQRIFQVYLSNMDRDLWYSDSLALDVMDEWKPRNKDDETERSSYQRAREMFEVFKQQRLTKPAVIDGFGVDLGAADAYRQLLDKGVEKQQARRKVELYGLRERAIAELRGQAIATDSTIARLDARITKEREASAVRYYLISANKLGWINVDRFYDAPNARECEVIATVIAPDGANVVNVSLIFGSTRMMVDGIKANDGRYHFTKEQDYYRRLPMGEEATMVAIAYTNGQPWLATKKIVIVEQVDEKLEMSAMSMDQFQAALKMFN